MMAYEFLAHDMVGMTLKDVTDGGLCLWEGTQEQEAEADAQIWHFAEHGRFYKPQNGIEYPLYVR